MSLQSLSDQLSIRYGGIFRRCDNTDALSLGRNGQAFQNMRLATSITGIDIYDSATLTWMIDMIGDEIPRPEGAVGRMTAFKLGGATQGSQWCKPVT